jgi:hypothetical protein
MAMNFSTHHTNNTWGDLGFVCECWNQRTAKAGDAHTLTKQSLTTLNKCFLSQSRMLMVEFMQQGTTITSEVYCQALENYVGPFRTKGLECSSMKIRVRMQLLALEHCWSISAGSCLTTLLTSLISLQATATCLRTWRTGWDHSTSTIMRSWRKLSKRGEFTGGRLLWQRHTTTYFPIQVYQFRRWLRWEVG